MQNMSMEEIEKAKKQMRQDPPISEYFRGNKQYYDTKEGVNVIKIFSGDWYVSKKSNDMLSTVLGSCVSACIRDPIAGVGGMNHFLLPGDNIEHHVSDSTRYGVFAMERLINEIIKAGGRKNRFEIKVFGGGNVIGNSTRIGSLNAQFIRGYLSDEGFDISSEDLEGEYPRRIHYYPATGKVMVRLLRRREDMVVVDEEALYRKSIVENPVEGSIELF